MGEVVGLNPATPTISFTSSLNRILKNILWFYADSSKDFICFDLSLSAQANGLMKRNKQGGLVIGANKTGGMGKAF
ncbi:hypothetical protein HCN_1281 [Helicobacter cinaedi PAGU611]|uniref:Uncharacterized protein n=1 Tax=Helicobacter cinaedi CCUG 18818 = ATCC BAA-847 TaxID=537971 RepID=A0AAI8QGP8_9HELI|nr:hypothetical protein C6B36_06575 [Helicobacter cinaedi]QOQ91896.1 hypothetical protein HW260_06680 [Helicobacter cinaedi]QOQ97093.1 hypothetical protein HW245_00075 [Helicobacter cinaedi]BAM12491.1 hypothetical protein HCN_1281 [Helicobacter cinaedi PAGU611]BAM31918.1 hypothetical protein HCBAA847_0680 [Helicobacter cinaedi CCUG 18818 = ATCC BAA-847]